MLVTDHPLPTHTCPGRGNCSLQLLQAVILRHTQNMPDTKLVPSFLQVPKPCIADHSRGSSHWFSTHLSFLHRKWSIFFQKISATIRIQLCAATVPKGSLLLVSLRSLFEGWFIGCLCKDWGRVRFFLFSVFSFKELFFLSDAQRNAYCSMQYSLWDGENITVQPSVEKHQLF